MRSDMDEFPMQWKRAIEESAEIMHDMKFYTFEYVAEDHQICPKK